MKSITETLKILIASHGEDIIQQPQRLKAMLADLLPNEKRMRYLLELSLRAEIPKKLTDIQQDEKEVQETKTNALKHYFKEEFFLEDNAVKSVFNCWQEIGLFICSIELSVDYDMSEGEYIDKYGVKYNSAKTKLVKLTDNLIHYDILPTTKVICNNAFYNCSLLKSISIPDSIELIGEIDFWEDDVFEEFIVSPSNRHFSANDGVLYTKDKTEVIRFPIAKYMTDFSIPLDVEKVGEYAFQTCKYLKTIHIGANVTFIDIFSFNECLSLEEINVDNLNNVFCSINGVLYSKDKKKVRRFPSANKNTEYQIIDGVEMIVSMAFYSCLNLENVIIPVSVTQIGYRAFFNCSELKQLIIPENVFMIEESAFSNCIVLNSLSVCKNNKNFEIKDRSLIDLNENKLLFYPIQSNYRRYKVPDGVITIACNAFFFNCLLEEVFFPASLKKIETKSFLFCRSLKYAYLPIGIEYIGEAAFSLCQNLKSVTILNSQTIIEIDAFKSCEKLELICIDYTANTADFKLFNELSEAFKSNTSVTILKTPIWSELIFQTIYTIVERIAKKVISENDLTRADVDSIIDGYYDAFVDYYEKAEASNNQKAIEHIGSYLDENNWENLREMVYKALKNRSMILFKDMISPLRYNNSNGFTGKLFLFLSSIKNGKTHYLTGESFFESFNYVTESLKTIITESENSLQSIIYDLKEYNKEKDVFWINDIIGKLNSADLEENIKTEFLEMMNKK